MAGWIMLGGSAIALPSRVVGVLSSRERDSLPCSLQSRSLLASRYCVVMDVKSSAEVAKVWRRNGRFIGVSAGSGHSTVTLGRSRRSSFTRYSPSGETASRTAAV